MIVPRQYESFLTSFCDTLPRLAEERCPELADSFAEATLSTAQDQQHTLELPHRANPRWAFRPHHHDTQKKTFNIEFAVPRMQFLPDNEVRTAWRHSGLDGEVWQRGPETRFWRAWGHGENEYDRLIGDTQFIRELQTWGFDGMCVALRLVKEARPLFSF